jgi:glycosyltransferase involved in cell wall biosynthesis
MDNFPASGGSELLKNALLEKSSLSSRDNINLIMSIPDIKNIKYSKQNILWQHLNHREPTLGQLTDRAFVDSVDAFVYVSNWQYEKYMYSFDIPTKNAHVIKNAINPIELIAKPKEKIKLIYTSTPYRGLDILLEAFSRLDRDDVELDIYSSTIIYGSGFAEHVGDEFEPLFERARNMKNVNYMGYATNEEIHKALQEAHIFAYPSIFEETSCLALIEAGAAGCSLVTTNFGALYETGSEYAKFVTMQKTVDKLVSNFTNALNEAIDSYWDKSNQKLLKEQSAFYNKFYSWDTRIPEWERLFDKLS